MRRYARDMDLRDRFAAHFAAALVDALADPAQIASRAYDLAEAMLRERDRRVDDEEESAIAGEGASLRAAAPLDFESFSPFDAFDVGPEPFDPEAYDPDAYDAFAGDEAFRVAAHAALLDDPEPMEAEPEWADEDLPDWLEAPYDPRWELEARWASPSSASDLAPRRASDSRPPGPGLARTQAPLKLEPRKSGGGTG